MIFRLLFYFGFIIPALPAFAQAQAQRGLAGHWKLDGDARDASIPAHDGVLYGRSDFFDSPIGGSGKLLWGNGVDTAVHVERMVDLAGGDFSVSLWFCPLDLASAGIIGQGSEEHGWAMELASDRVFRFRANGKTIDTPAERVGFGQWYHLAAAVHAGGKMTLYVNGELAAEGDAAPAAPAPQPLLLLIGCTQERGPFVSGLIDDVRVFTGALDANEIAEITDGGLPWLRSRPLAKKPFAGRFTLERDDLITFVGGEDANAAQTAGYLETLLATASADKHLVFRNMAWEGDTVFEQWRILNFGPWSRQFERVGASVIFVQFGQMESLNGKAGLEEFTAAYAKLLDEFQQRTQRIVLVSPTPFVATPPPLHDLTAHNEDLKLYADAVKKLAEKRGLLYVDLLTTVRQPPHSPALKRDGVHLTPFGQWIAAQETAHQLGFNATDPVTPDEQPKFERKELEQIRTGIVRKNELWLRYWRPNNWAFMNGDRVTQAASRDDVDRRIRWLPAEVQQFPALIAKQEAAIERELKALAQP
jgi:hypothetical protein